MDELIEITQRNIVINRKDILRILSFQDEDIIFLSGSLIEGIINKYSKGMGNKLSDIDVFILSNDVNKIQKSTFDYEREGLKTQFKKQNGVDFDIEIHCKKSIVNLIDQLNTYNFDDSIRTFNALKLPTDFDFYKFTSFLHRLQNSIVIYNEKEFDSLISRFNRKNYFKLMTRVSVNKIDLYYEDVVGNIENGQLEVAVNIARTILLETMKAYLFHMKSSIDRDKWIPLKLKNLAQYNDEVAEIYVRFKKLYFEEKLDEDSKLQANAESIIEFSNYVINKIGQEGEL
ncbi:hypothetical protein [Clostridium thermarum]|uniref:hypothetical protein n=1 Tax=Clostridium thermarum TaxID=1716543 RepID=UPI0013D2A4F3|nr:hypothetical protein [Clostridium thermarum]